MPFAIRRTGPDRPGLLPGAGLDDIFGMIDGIEMRAALRAPLPEDTHAPLPEPAFVGARGSTSTAAPELWALQL